MSAPLLALLDQQPDLFDEYSARPHGLALVRPADPDEAPRRKTLADYVTRVDYIADTIEALDAEIDDATRDQITAELVAELAGTRAKVDAVASTLAMFEHLEAAAKAERERLEKRATMYGRRRERLELYVLAVLEASKLDQIDGDTSTLKRRANPARVVIDSEAAIPADFMRTPEPPPPPAAKPDKTAIAKALKAKRDVPGCRLEQGARLVRS